MFDRRVLIVEDDAFTGSLMVGALANAGFQTMLATNALDAKKTVATFDPDLMLIDIDLGKGPNGVDLVRVLKKSNPDIALILLSSFADTASAGAQKATIPEGVSYLRKSLVHTTEGLVDAINEALRGQSRPVRQDLLSQSDLDKLTDIQRAILRMMALGLSNPEIASQRQTSLSAVEQHIAKIFKALGIPGSDQIVPRVEAIRIYVSESGLPKRNS